MTSDGVNSIMGNKSVDFFFFLGGGGQEKVIQHGQPLGPKQIWDLTLPKLNLLVAFEQRGKDFGWDMTNASITQHLNLPDLNLSSLKYIYIYIYHFCLASLPVTHTHHIVTRTCICILIILYTMRVSCH